MTKLEQRLQFGFARFVMTLFGGVVLTLFVIEQYLDFAVGSVPDWRPNPSTLLLLLWLCGAILVEVCRILIESYDPK